MSDKLSIKVTIANRVYPLTINRDEEEQIRKAVDYINENMRELENSYAVRDKQDLLAMTALYFADKSLAAEQRAAEVLTDSSAEVEKVQQQIAEYLSGSFTD